jgi:hypothetical protein
MQLSRATKGIDCLAAPVAEQCLVFYFFDRIYAVSCRRFQQLRAISIGVSCQSCLVVFSYQYFFSIRVHDSVFVKFQFTV